MKKQESEVKTLRYGDIDTILKDISDMPEVSRDEKEIKGKDEIIKALEKGILSMLRKGYSIKATMEFLNERLSPYTVNEAEVKKLLRKVTTKKKTPNTKSASKSKKKEPASNEQNADDVGVPSMPETESEVHDEAKVKMPYPMPEDERIYLVSTIAEKDIIKALGAKYESSEYYSCRRP
jgi:hypothetical protein